MPTVRELRIWLTKHNLDSSGLKGDLEARWKAAGGDNERAPYEQNEESSSDEDGPVEEEFLDEDEDEDEDEEGESRPVALTEYEQQRKQKMRANEQFMIACGLTQSKAKLDHELKKEEESAVKRPKKGKGSERRAADRRSDSEESDFELGESSDGSEEQQCNSC